MDSTFVLKRGGIISYQGGNISDKGIKERKKEMHLHILLFTFDYWTDSRKTFYTAYKKCQ